MSAVVSRVERRIRASLERGMIPGAEYSRFVRQLRVVSQHTGETLEEVAMRMAATSVVHTRVCPRCRTGHDRPHCDQQESLRK